MDEDNTGIKLCCKNAAMGIFGPPMANIYHIINWIIHTNITHAPNDERHDVWLLVVF